MKRLHRIGKVMIFAVVLLMSVLVFAGCSNGDKTDAPPQDQQTTTPPATSQNKALADAEAKLMEALAPLPEKGTDVKIGALALSLTNPFWVTVKEGYEDAAKEYGVTVDVMAAQKEDDANGQLDAFKALIAKGYGGITISAMTPFNLVPGVVEANQKDIKIVAVGTTLDEKAAAEAKAKIEAFVTSDFKEQGRMGAEFIMKKIGGNAKVAVIEGLAGADQGEARKQGAIEGFEANGGEVVSVQAGDWDRQKAYDITAALIDANPDLKGIMCANDVMALGAVEALKAKGKKGDVVVVGIDFIEEAKTSIVNGELDGSVAMSPYLFGKAGLIISLKAMQGQEISEDIYWTPIGMISKDNVDQYEGWK